jgi:signal transduction histidine kinase
MTSDALLAMNPSDPRYAEMGALLEECVSQTRTISYLLHPPFLDEVGFVSAAKWLIKGYSKRTGIDVSVDISEQVKRLPRHLELTLFRILQETLTNIHRHAKSARAQVSVQVKSQEVFLVVKDFGKGIPRDTLADFEANGTHVGVGLAGMKERVREFGGKWDLKSGDGGTEITVKMPLTADDDVAPAQSDSFS